MNTMPTTVSQPELDQFVQLVQSYRDRTGMSISELARRADVRIATMSELLSGSYRHSPSFDLVSKVAKCCEIKLVFEQE